MTKEEDLIKLESIVSNLMERYTTIKKQKIELEAQLKAKEEKIGELRETINSLQEEKSTVHGRVTNLLGSIEMWEKSLGGDHSAEDFDLPVLGKTGDDEVTESKLF